MDQQCPYNEIINANPNGAVANNQEAQPKDQNWIMGKVFQDGFEEPEETKRRRLWASLVLDDTQISIFPRQMKFSMNFPKEIKLKELKKLLNAYNRFFKRFITFMYEVDVPQAKTAQEADDAMQMAWQMYCNWWFAQAEADEADNYNDGDKQQEEELPNQENNIIDYEKE